MSNDCSCRWVYIGGKRHIETNDCPVHEDVSALFDEQSHLISRRDPSSGNAASPRRGNTH